MIVRFFNTGTSNGESPVGYLLRIRDHQGNLRPEAPELLAGSPQLTIDLINGIGRKHKYSSGCLAFRAEEQPTRAELFKIIDRFKDTVAPGLSHDQYNSLFVLHREPPDPKTGLAGFHVHFLFPMVMLAGKSASGKSLVGRRFNPHPPGQRTIETMALFTQIINQDHGWAQVTEKPLRVGMDAFWRKVDTTRHNEKADILQMELKRAINSGAVNNRADLVTYMDQTLGMTITRITENTVSVKFPGANKAMRLRGAMFEVDTDYTLLREAHKREGTEMLSVPDYLEALLRLNQLLKVRAAELQGHRPKTPHNRTTRKERVYGRQHEKRLGGGHAGHQAAGRQHQLPIPKGGLERDLLQTGAGQRRHELGERHPTNHERPQEAANPVQTVGNAGQSASGGQQFRRGSGRVTTSAAGDLEQKIWALSVELNDCEVGSPEAMAVLTQLAILQGEKERIPKGRKLGL